MPLWGMIIDLDKCTACRACITACKVENNIPISSPQTVREHRVINWLEMVLFPEEAREEHPWKVRILPRPCFHCDKPPCIKVCPVFATYKNEEGIVAQIYPRCIGCRYCMNNCPYNVKKFNWFEPHWPETMKQCFNPDVSVRPKGVVEKCTFCHHRLIKAEELAKAEGRELQDGDYLPACVQACPSGAMYFGDLNDPNSQVYHLSRSPRVFRLLEDMGTEPKVLYLTEEKSV